MRETESAAKFPFLTFRQTALLFICFTAVYFTVVGILTLHGCVAGPAGTGVVGGVIGAAAEGASGFLHGMVARGVITPQEGGAWAHFIDTTVAAVDAANTAIAHGAEAVKEAKQAAGTAQLTAGGVGFGAIASDQAHKVLAIRAAKRGA